MSQPRDLNRRRFIKAASTTLAAPLFVPSSALGKDGSIAPSNRTAIAHIGVGGRGSGLLKNFIGEEVVQTVAVCDIDSQHRDKAATTIDQHYTKTKPRTGYKGAKTYHDYRELINDPAVDAVVVAIPDHWHAMVTCHAAQAGKDIYCEKPLTLTVAEGRRVVDTVTRLGRVLQVGSHERSRSNARYACELVRNGRIGKLHTIRVNMPVTNHGPIPPQPNMPVPKHLDWNTWLGPAPWAEYTEKRNHFWFRYNLDYSGGEMTDRGAHVMDIAQLGNGTDHTTPVEVSGKGWRPTDGLFNTFMKFDFEFKYANGVRMIGKSIEPRGIKFEGTDGWVFVHIHGGNLEASHPALLREVIGPDEIHLGRSPGHHLDFINCVRNRGTPMASVNIGHHTATLCHLANIAMLTQEKLKWDPDNERFTNSEAANRMLDRPKREPFHL